MDWRILAPILYLARFVNKYSKDQSNMFRVWRVINLLMRTKSFGPARVKYSLTSESRDFIFLFAAPLSLSLSLSLSQPKHL